MRNIFIAFVLFFFSSSLIQAQAWFKNGTFSPGAVQAFHKVWGEPMGYTPQETMEELIKIYKNGQFENKYVYNSGIKPDGTINFLKQGTYQVTYLGSTDATLIDENQPGWTIELYLKKDCYNLCWVFLPPAKEEKKEHSYVPEPKKNSYIFEPKQSANADERLVRVQRIDSQYINGYLANSLDFNHPDVFWVPFWEWKERYENEKTVRRLNCRTVIETSYKLL